LVVSFTGVWVLGRSLQDQVYDQADQEVQQEAAFVASYLEREGSFIVSQLTLAVEEGRMLIGNQTNLAQAMSGLDMMSIMRMLGFGANSLVKIDLVKIVGPDGETVLELHRDLLAGRRLDDEALVTKGLGGSSCGDIVTTTDGKSAYLVGAAALGGEGPGSDGLLILGSKINRDVLAGTGMSERMLFAFTDDGIAACSDGGYSDADWTQALATASGGRLTVGGERYVMASAPVNVNGAPSAVRVATVMPLEALAAQAADDWTHTWLIFAAGAAVLVLAGLVVAQRLVQPVRQLTAATARLQQGDFDTRIEVKREDEIGRLAQAFNTMGQELKTRDARLAETFNEVKRLSETDALTGLLNHRMITEQIGRELARVQRYGGRFGLMIVDLDNFKLLNDTYGHPVGDEALRRISRLLIEQTREVDSLGRCGGDEFMLVLPECGPLELAGAAEKLQSVLAATAFEAPDGSLVPIKMSLGVACYPDDGHDANTLIALADANLYLSKSRGGGTITGAQIDNASTDDRTVFGMLGSLVTIVDNKDRYTRHHSEEVTALALSIGEALNLSDESQRVLRVAGLLHDVGKIGVPDRILRKPGRLTGEEYETIKQHSVLGDAIIAAIPDLSEIRAAVLSHHERFDGHGYPNELSGDRIPLLARILAVADSYSAMVTDRPYRKALGKKEAIAELLAGKGTQFDPGCVDAFLGVLGQQDEILEAERTDVVTQG
jgi:diguanylate cyclase (GGDEF)-like protein/putative nucleotidyltransferase with HDIG domain